MRARDAWVHGVVARLGGASRCGAWDRSVVAGLHAVIWRDAWVRTVVAELRGASFSPTPRVVRALALALALCTTASGVVRAQDFAPASPSGPQPGATALLESGLPAAARAWSFETAATRWLGLASLETRAAALGVAAGSVRVAAGLSQTGDPELGWTGAALAAGAAGPEGGAALRVVGRRDRSGGALLDGRLALGAGYEAGAGAWLAAAPGLTLWASAPQLWCAGQAPPLSRPLELGGRYASAGGALWLALVAPRAGDDGERVAGLEIGTAALAVWAEARDGPLRGSLGVRGALGALAIDARADAHPVLGETTRLSLAWRGRAAGAAGAKP